MSKILTLSEFKKSYPRGLRAAAHYEGEFVELLNKEMETLLKNIEANKDFNKFNENNSINSIGDKNETERNQ